jgi:hypothetical protein
MKDDLLDRARIALSGRRRQKTVYLRRAVSDAYYAIFHALCINNADYLVGVTRRGSEAWARIYRGLDHSKAKELFRRSAFQSRSPNFEIIAAAFIELQEQRHLADYDPTPNFRSRGQVGPIIRLSELAIQAIEALPADDARLLASLLITKDR